MSRLLTFLEMKTPTHQRFRNRKDERLKPLLVWLHRHNITPTHISLTGLVIGVLGLPVLWINYWWFIIIELVSALFDGLDGPLARTTGQSNDAGAQLDFVVDVTVGIAMCVAYIIWLREPSLALCLDGYGILLLCNWLANSPVKVAPGRMLMVLVGILALPGPGIALAGAYSIYMLWQLGKRIFKRP